MKPQRLLSTLFFLLSTAWSEYITLLDRNHEERIIDIFNRPPIIDTNVDNTKYTVILEICLKTAS